MIAIMVDCNKAKAKQAAAYSCRIDDDMISEKLLFCQLRAIDALAVVLMVAWCLHVASSHKIFMGRHVRACEWYANSTPVRSRLVCSDSASTKHQTMMCQSICMLANIARRLTDSFQSPDLKHEPSHLPATSAVCIFYQMLKFKPD